MLYTPGRQSPSPSSYPPPKKPTPYAPRRRSPGWPGPRTHAPQAHTWRTPPPRPPQSPDPSPALSPCGWDSGGWADRGAKLCCGGQGEPGCIVAEQEGELCTLNSSRHSRCQLSSGPAQLSTSTAPPTTFSPSSEHAAASGTTTQPSLLRHPPHTPTPTHSAGLNMFLSSRHWVGMGEAGPSRPCSSCSAAGNCRRAGAAGRAGGFRGG